MSPAIPPLDGSIRVFPGFTDFHHEHNPDLPFARFAREESGEITRISYREFARASHRVAHALRDGGKGKNGEVVALIAVCDSLMYMALLVGITRAGLVPFPISPRNSPAAIYNMLSKTSCHHLLTTKAFLQPMLDGSKEEFASKQYDLQIDEIPNFAETFPLLGREKASDSFEPFVAKEDWNPAMDDPALYLHSSGSTGFPKPIAQTHRTVLHWCSMPCTTEALYHPRKIVWGSMAPPTFHTFGLYMQYYSPMVSATEVAIFEPKAPAPPVMPTPENTLAAAKASGANTVVVVPAFLEAYIHSKEAVEFLSQMELVTFAGGPLSAKAGGILVSHGVKLNVTYGGTEFGAPSHLFDTNPENKGPFVLKSQDDWGWVAFSDRMKARWMDQGDGSYELHMLTNEKHQLSVENLPDTKGYATSDLWEKHPTVEGLWRLVGRTDDLIVLGSGEKTVPSPMEGHVIANPLVQGALMFGRGRNQVGILIEPHPAHVIDPKDEKAVIDFRNSIWPSVEESNKDAPAFSRLFKEMIIFTDPSKTMARAAKGTVMRKMTTALYAEEIDALYETVESSTRAEGVEPPDSWRTSDLIEWLSRHAEQINGRKVDPRVDLFEQGFDSLSATFLRNRIMGALRISTDPAAKQALAGVMQNIVYVNPTLEQLANTIVSLVAGPSGVHGLPKDSSTKAMTAMVEKYSSHFPKLPSALSSPASGEGGAIVLLSGSTGSLGSYILAALLEDPRVARVYAFNRTSDTSPSIDRQKAAFSNKGLPTGLLLSAISSTRVLFVDGDATQDKLGQASNLRLYDQIHSTVTHIVHNAWRVDFNLALSSFEPNVRATRGLIDFALTSKLGSQVKFLFTSSITVAQAWDISKGPFPEEVILKPDAAVGGGYGEGKYVAEKVLAAASENGLQSTSFRIGQICGGLPDGAWATTDWVPILVKSSIALGCLPESEGTVSWLPMQAVAQAILDIGLDADEPPLALNVVHPRPVKWTDIMDAVRTALAVPAQSLPLVTLSEWVDKLDTLALQATVDDYERIPAIRLLEFFRKLAVADKAARDRGQEHVEAGGLAAFATDKTQARSMSIRELESLNQMDVQRWVKYWKSRGFI